MLSLTELHLGLHKVKPVASLIADYRTEFAAASSVLPSSGLYLDLLRRIESNTQAMTEALESDAHATEESHCVSSFGAVVHAFASAARITLNRDVPSYADLEPLFMIYANEVVRVFTLRLFEDSRDANKTSAELDQLLAAWNDALEEDQLEKLMLKTGMLCQAVA